MINNLFCLKYTNKAFYGRNNVQVRKFVIVKLLFLHAIVSFNLRIFYNFDRYGRGPKKRSREMNKIRRSWLYRGKN